MDPYGIDVKMSIHKLDIKCLHFMNVDFHKTLIIALLNVWIFKFYFCHIRLMDVVLRRTRYALSINPK